MDYKVLIPFILFLASQTATGIWWAGQTDTAVDRLQQDISTVQQNQLDIQSIKSDQQHAKEQLLKNETLLQEILREIRDAD